MSELLKHKDNLRAVLKAKQEEYLHDEAFDEIVVRQQTIVSLCEENEALKEQVAELVGYLTTLKARVEFQVGNELDQFIYEEWEATIAKHTTKDGE